MKVVGSLYFLLLLLASYTLQEKLDFDPYNVFGISKSASNDEIRKVYKKLVKEWHPDKNKSPDAEDNFIKIQQAYEILSDEDKREQFDTGGYSGNTAGQWHYQNEGFNFQYSDFNQDFFNSQGSSRTISAHDFYRHVLPDSHLTPQLIYVYSTFCVQCILWLRTSWQKAAADIESLGVSVSTVDTTFHSQIASSLGVNRVPTIVGIYREKIYYFKGQIAKEELKYFIKSFLPNNLIEKLTSATATKFLSNVEIDDKPRAILFSDRTTPTLLYTLMAIKYQQYISFGFVNQRDKDAAEFIQYMQVNRNGPTLLLFKENLTKPAVVLGASEMPRGAINEILGANKFLVLPRLTSQHVFDELCPSPQGAVHTVRLCLILLSDPAYKDYKVVSGTLKNLVEVAEVREENLNEWLRFMHVHASKQPAFARSLSLDEKEESKIFLFWRRSQSSGSILTHNIEFLHQPANLAQQGFQLCLREALEAAHLQRFQKTISLAPLVDELAPFIAIQVLRTLVGVFEYSYNFLMNMNEKNFMTVIMLIMLCASVFNTLFPRNAHAEKNKQEKAKEKTEKNPSDVLPDENNTSTDEESESTMSEEEAEVSNEPPKAKTFEFLHELVPSNYDDLVLQMTRGHMTIVLLVDDNTSEGQSVLQEYENTMRIYARDPKISTTYLNIEKYSSWYFEIHRTSSAQPPLDSDEEATEDTSTLHGYARSSSRNEKNEQNLSEIYGTVLVINSARHWYCIFVPRGITWGSRKNAVAGADKSDTSEETTYEEALSCWMDRVREGQMPRLYVRQWPGLYIHPPTNNEEDDF